MGLALTPDALAKAVAQHAAFRRRRRLQPVGGPGDKLFPSTYPPTEGERRANPKAPPRHVFECRRINGEDVWCVLLDSVQSQANRLEEALLRAAEAERIELPRLEVDFAHSGLNSVGRITSLDAPHRVFDAILRDSVLDGEAFQRSALGLRLKQATARDATALLEASPSALLFGAWNSTGEGGGIGAKFPRAIVSEIIGVNVPVERLPGSNEPRTFGRRTGSRIDPLGINKRVDVYEGADGWGVTEKAAGKGAKKVRPSEINHGNIAPSVEPLGVTCDYAEQTAVITLAGLRRLHFGGEVERDTAARCLLAALGLLALVELDAQGYALRSRCDLVCEGAAPLELVHSDGSTSEINLDSSAAEKLYAETLKRARKAGFRLEATPTALTPQDKLVHIVRQSMERALADQGQADADDVGN